MPTDLMKPAAWLSFRRKRFWALLLVAVYSVFGFLVVPQILGSLAPGLIRDNVQREATLGDISFNPWTLRLQINDFALIDTDERNLLEFESLIVNLAFTDLSRLALGFDEITLNKPQVLIARYAFADSNIGRVLSDIEAASDPALQEPPAADSEANSEESGELRLHIAKLSINEGVLKLEDALTEETFNTSIEPISITVNELSTLPEVSGTQSINLVTENGMELKWEGTLELSPLISTGRVSLSGTPLPTVYRYFKNQLNFTFDNCCLEVSFDYSANALTSGDIGVNINNADILLSNIDLNTKATDEPLFRMPALRISGGRLAWLDQTAHIDQILLEQPELYVWLNEDGSVNLEQLLVAQEAENSSTESAAEPLMESPTLVSTEPVANDVASDEISDEISDSESAPWAVTLGEFKVDRMQLAFTDNSITEPGQIGLNPMTLSVTDISLAPNSRWSIQYDATLASGGQLAFNGSLIAMPEVQAEGQLTVSELALPVLQPWIQEAAQIKLERGDLNIDLAINSAPDETLGVAGDINVVDLSISDTIKQESLVGWQRLGILDTRLALDANTLDIARVKIEQPFARVLIAADGSTNFESLAQEGEQAEGQEEGQAEQTPAANNGPAPATQENTGADTAAPMRIKVTSTTVTDGNVDFSDLSLPLPFRVLISEFGGKVSAIDSSSQQPSALDFKGRVGEYGQMTMKGDISLLAPTEKTDVQLDFKNLSMPTLSPYTAEFVGRKIKSGKLNLALDYQLDNNKIVGANNVMLSDFKLGDRVDNPDAMNLPLDVALALLTDSKGVIDLDLNISGDLDDPSFSASGLIMKTFANVILKTASAPFKVLGRLLPEGKNVDLKAIDFEPGSAVLNPPEREKLVLIATTMQEFPSLQLELSGGFNETADTKALQVGLLNNEITNITGKPEEAELLTRANRKVLERLAKQQLPELSLDTLRKQYDIVNEDTGNALFDELAYTTALRARLEAAQTVTAEDAQKLAGQRRDAMLAFMATLETLDSRQYTAGESNAETEIDERGLVSVPLALNPIEPE
ncbi:MAG: DUF748 domain-containing protein [Gammaproteobacteria bacterium]|nr:DUF748 domain-containing protein [Gammaproteobacteria bacterium]